MDTEKVLRACVDFMCVTPVISQFVDFFLLPRELVGDRCPWCEAIFWYRGPPIFEDLENCECYVHSCDSSGTVLCSCTINSTCGMCPCCGLYDSWIIIPRIFFLRTLKVGR